MTARSTSPVVQAYHPPGIGVVVTVSVGVSGGGFTPGEQISITVVYNGPSGLRAERRLRRSQRESRGRIVVADGNGNFIADVSVDRSRSGRVIVTGLSSGRLWSFRSLPEG